MNEDKSNFLADISPSLTIPSTNYLLDRIQTVYVSLRKLESLALQREIGFLSHYSQWTSKFSDRIRPLITATLFPLDSWTEKVFENLEVETEKVQLHSIDGNSPSIVETKGSNTEVAVVPTHACYAAML